MDKEKVKSSTSTVETDIDKSKVDAYLFYQQALAEISGKHSSCTFKLGLYRVPKKLDNDLSKNEKESLVSQDLSPNGVKGHCKITEKGKEYICDMDNGECKRSFTKFSYLKSHQHHCTQQLKCPDCGRKFIWSHHLNYHIRAHRGLKLFKCDEPKCDKTFCTSQQRSVHMRIHTGEKPFVCKVCSKGFTTAQNLNNHSRIHTGEKPYACDYDGCGKTFAEKSTLKKHYVTHTGVKNYKCVYCEKCFTQSSTLYWHIRRYHTENAPPSNNIASIQARQKALQIAARNVEIECQHQEDAVIANTEDSVNDSCDVTKPTSASLHYQGETNIEVDSESVNCTREGSDLGEIFEESVSEDMPNDEYNIFEEETAVINTN